jgi:hypothetical protein
VLLAVLLAVQLVVWQVSVVNLCMGFLVVWEELLQPF